MKIIKTKFKGLKIIKQKDNRDKRGSLRETYNKKTVGNNKFIFEYCTTSKKKRINWFICFFLYNQSSNPLFDKGSSQISISFSFFFKFFSVFNRVFLCLISLL